MYSIAIIGVGNIGRRHLQSNLKINKDCVVYAVENSEDTRLSLYEEFSNNRSCIIISSVDELPHNLDFCILATSADVRRRVLEDLFNKSIIVRYMILEKFLFQRYDDYYWMACQIRERKIDVWVDCVRREYSDYQKLREKLASEDDFSVKISGGNWGFCCNTVHYLDLVKFLAMEDKLIIEEYSFENPIEEAKRSGFLECYGRVIGRCGRCTRFEIECLNKEYVPLMIHIYGKNQAFFLDEDLKTVISRRTIDGLIYSVDELDVPYLSELSGKVVRGVLETGQCRLPRYADAMETHLAFMHGLQPFLSKNGKGDEVCPIT